MTDLRKLLLKQARPQPKHPNEPQPTIPEKPVLSRAAETIRAELGAARDSMQALNSEMAAAQQELADAHQRFDRAMQAYALEEVMEEPSRDEMRAAHEKEESLERIR